MTAKCRVLYVDDHEDSAFMFKQLLSLSDYEVSVAATMELALTLAKGEEFDLYVLDKRLPDGTGVDLCRQLSQITPGVPVIFYSGDVYELHRQEALMAGARAYVTKPGIDKLIDTVHQLLSERECATAA